MKRMSMGTKIGLMIQGVATIVMIILVILSKPISDVIIWIITSGYIITIISLIIQKRSELNN